MFWAVATERSDSPSSALFRIAEMIGFIGPSFLLDNEIGMERARGLDRLQDRDGSAGVDMGARQPLDEVGHSRIREAEDGIIGALLHFHPRIGDDEAANVRGKPAGERWLRGIALAGDRHANVALRNDDA